MSCAVQGGEYVMGNLFIREFRGDAGSLVDGHTHRFDHVTIVFRGAIRVKAHTPTEVIEREFRAPAKILIRADTRHEITVLEDDTEYWCVYAHRTPQGEVSQQFTGWEAAYG